MGSTAMRLERSAMALALVGVMACATGAPSGSGQQEGELGVPPGEEPAAAAAPELELAVTVRHDELARLGFPAPYRARTTSRHFDTTLPAKKMRHEILIEPEGHAAVRIDVWDDPARLPIGDWFERHLPSLRLASDRVEPLRVTRAGLEGMLIDHPSSPQSASMRTALVSTGERVFRITCLDAEDPVSHALFARIVSDLAPDELLAAEEVTP